MVLTELLFAWHLYSRTTDLPGIEPEPISAKVVEVQEEPKMGQGYRQTFYSVIGNNETNLGYIGLSYKEARNINNVMHYFDDQYGWLPVVAVDIDAVIASGKNEVGTYNIYGTVLNIDYEDGTNADAIILDACGACAEHDRIDLWVYRDDYTHDKRIEAITVVRQGFEEENE